MTVPHDAVTFADVRVAARHMAGRAHVTPVATCRALDDRASCSLVLKCEQLQRAGAFKFRGAISALKHLSPEMRERGVVTHSSGNHGQALALAARDLGVRATIVIPDGAPRVKRAAVAEYGGEVVPCANNLDARESAAAKLQADGAILIPPYDHPHIIAGQAVATWELINQAGSLDAIVAPVGGGGLLSGACVAAAHLSPATAVIGAEPAGADDAARSLAERRRIPADNPNTIADGLRTSLGGITWPIIRDHARAIVTVSDEEIVSAMRLCWERAKLLIEPSAAVAVAAVVSPKLHEVGQFARVGVILSGGNTDLDRLPF